MDHHPSPSPPPRRGPIHLLVTAGPTREPIDDVRFVGNRSSGRMGLAIATAGAARGWPVTLLLGPVDLAPAESSIRVRRFETTAELQALLAEEWPRHDLLAMAAAVADHRPVRHGSGGHAVKIRRSDGPITLRLEPTPDLLAELASSTRSDQRAFGFALEPAEHLMASAADKLRRKRLHGIVANPLETMGSEEIQATLLLADGRRLVPPRPRQPKCDFAEWLVDAMAAELANG